MGGAVRAVTRIVGGLLGISNEKPPQVNSKPAQDEVDEEEGRAKRARDALFATAGGQAGAQLAPGQVSGTRDTLFGN